MATTKKAAPKKVTAKKAAPKKAAAKKAVPKKDVAKKAAPKKSIVKGASSGSMLGVQIVFSTNLTSEIENKLLAAIDNTNCQSRREVQNSRRSNSIKYLVTYTYNGGAQSLMDELSRNRKALNIKEMVFDRP